MQSLDFAFCRCILAACPKNCDSFGQEKTMPSSVQLLELSYFQVLQHHSLTIWQQQISTICTPHTYYPTLKMTSSHLTFPLLYWAEKPFLEMLCLWLEVRTDLSLVHYTAHSPNNKSHSTCTLHGSIYLLIQSQ